MFYLLRLIRLRLFQRKVWKFAYNFFIYDYNASIIPTCNNRYLDFMRAVIHFKDKLRSTVDKFFNAFGFCFDDIIREGDNIYIYAKPTIQFQEPFAEFAAVDRSLFAFFKFTSREL